MTLGGSTFIRNGIQFDYNFVETIDCLSELCDQVVVVDAGSDDGTTEKLAGLLDSGRWKNTTIITLSKEEWDAQHGREKLSYFSNIAISHLETEWNFYLQCDEVVNEKSFPWIRQAISEDGASAFLCRRFNLWKDPFHILNVEQSRKPCSTEVLRLARTHYRCYDDAESLGVDCPVSIDYLSKIEIWHMGFVRKREVMKAKIINMQEVVFEVDHDKRLDKSDIFVPMDYFSEKDLMPIHKPLPKFIQAWADERKY